MKKPVLPDPSPVISERFERRLNGTLQDLEGLCMRRESMRTRRAGWTIAVALLTILALGAVAYAAAPLWERIFGYKAQRIDEYQALPEDEKLQQAIEEIESHRRSHQIGETALFEGCGVTLRDAYASEVYDQDDNPIGSELQLTLDYEGIPPFDPNYVDFTLTMNGEDIPMALDEGLAQYRKRGRRLVTMADWEEDMGDWESGSKTFLDDGAASSSMRFAIDDWKIDAPTPMALSAVIDGKPLQIEFLFDPAKSHQEAVEEAQLAVRWTKESMSENQSKIETLMAHAAQVGITKSLGGYRCTVSELAYIREANQLYYTIAIEGVREARPFGVPWYREALRIDGIPTPWVGQTSSDTDEINDGTLTSIRGQTLWFNPNRLPEESLILLNMRHNEIGDMTFVFRYNWRTNEIIRPEDEAQEAEWIQEDERLQSQAQYEKPVSDGRVLVQDLGPLNLSQTLDGLTMTLEAVEIRSMGMTIYLKCDREFYGWGEERDRGLAVQYADWRASPQSWDSGGIHFRMPVNPRELPNEIPVSFDYPVTLKGEDGGIIYDQTFSFSLVVEQDKMEDRDQTWRRAR